MESLPYCILSAVYLALLLFLVALFIFIIGMAGMAQFTNKMKSAKTRGHKLAWTPGWVLSAALTTAGSLTVLTLLVLAVGFYMWSCGSGPDRYEGAVCLELAVAEDYKLQISKFRDGTYQAGLEKADGSQCYVYGITRSAIVGDYMVGVVGPESSPIWWFWFDLTGEGPSHHFKDRTEFINALQEISLLKLRYSSFR
jgi:hypothetical protein